MHKAMSLKEVATHPASGKALGKTTIMTFSLPASGPLARAFLQRANQALSTFLENADEASLERAVAAPTDAGTLARAASDSVTAEAVTELDPLAALLAQGAEQKAELLRQCGGGLSVTEVAKVLGITRQGVDKRRRESKLLAVPRGADYRFPACQFADGEVIAGVPQVLEQLGEHTWNALAFLATPLEELNERSPLEVFKTGKADEKELALRLARALASEGFG